MRIRTASLTALVAVALVAPAAQARAADTYDITSVRYGGMSLVPNDASGFTLSEDGRFAAFATFVPLVPGDTDTESDVYRLDRATDEITWISRAPGAELQDLPAVNPAISADGRYVAFESQLNLVPSQRGPSSWAFPNQIFRYDATTSVLDLVSVTVDGVGSKGWASRPRISADGRYVIFNTAYSDFGVADDTNRRLDVYRRDMATGTTILASRTSTGDVFPCAGATSNGISSDGRYVLFTTRCGDPATIDTNGSADLFRFDSQSGTSVLISTTYDGRASGVKNAVLSGSGRVAAFESFSARIVQGDTPDTLNLFRVDLDTGVTTMVAGTTNSFAVTGLSTDGRYAAFLRTGEVLSEWAAFCADTLTGAVRRGQWRCPLTR